MTITWLFPHSEVNLHFNLVRPDHWLPNPLPRLFNVYFEDAIRVRADAHGGRRDHAPVDGGDEVVGYRKGG